MNIKNEQNGYLDESLLKEVIKIAGISILFPFSVFNKSNPFKEGTFTSNINN